MHLQCRRPWSNSWVGKIRWRKDRLPNQVFLGFPGGLAAKESACNARDLGSIPGLGRPPGEGKGYHSSILAWRIPLTIPWGRKELDMTEWLSLSLFIWWCPCVEASLVLLEEGVCYDQCILLAKLCYPMSCFILYCKVKLAYYYRYLLTSYFCIPVPYDEKDIFFVCVSSRRSYRSS